MTLIKICIWNANGVSQHKLEISNYLYTNHIDMLLISETHLTDKHNFHIQGYNFYKSNHAGGKSHDGAGIRIRSRIKHEALDIDSTAHIQAASISVKYCRQSLTLSAV